MEIKTTIDLKNENVEWRVEDGEVIITLKGTYWTERILTFRLVKEWPARVILKQNNRVYTLSDVSIWFDYVNELDKFELQKEFTFSFMFHKTIDENTEITFGF